MIRDIKDMTSFKWATVRGLNPLSIQLDGDPTPLALIPDSLVDPFGLTIGDRVRVELSERKVVVHGKANAGTEGYSLVQQVILTTSTTFLKANYPGARAFRIRVVGGGGSGAGCGGASGAMNSYGTGGGSGAYAESFITNLGTIPSSVAVTVGAGGAATAAGAIDGNNGGDSSFGSLVVAGGGGRGFFKPNSALGGYVQGGAGGVATAGQIQQGGSPGQTGMGRDTLAQSGNGGSSIFGGGGQGPATGGGSSSIAGNPGTAWGAGGSGAMANAGGTAKASGAGAAGVVIVEVYR
ncbi:hypothetical protein SEA_WILLIAMSTRONG_19 [Microbacterium phage WilliamStrong]|nr:hypothetical protein SEA_WILLIAMSTRONG_19 [Microbacterium phage WilliamStrong]